MFKLVTDNTADLPVSYLQEHNVGCMPISYILDGVTYGKDRELDWKYFYQMIREGKLPTTSQINPSEAKEFFEEYIKTDKEILEFASAAAIMALQSADATSDLCEEAKIVEFCKQFQRKAIDW